MLAEESIGEAFTFTDITFYFIEADIVFITVSLDAEEPTTISRLILIAFLQRILYTVSTILCEVQGCPSPTVGSLPLQCTRKGHPCQ